MMIGSVIGSPSNLSTSKEEMKARRIIQLDGILTWLIEVV